MHGGAAVQALEQAKAPVWSELRMPNHQEDVRVSLRHHSPGKVLDHSIVLVLSSTVISMEIHPYSKKQL